MDNQELQDIIVEALKAHEHSHVDYNLEDGSEWKIPLKFLIEDYILYRIENQPDTRNKVVQTVSYYVHESNISGHIYDLLSEGKLLSNSACVKNPEIIYNVRLSKPLDLNKEVSNLLEQSEIRHINFTTIGRVYKIPVDHVINHMVKFNLSFDDSHEEVLEQVSSALKVGSKSLIEHICDNMIWSDLKDVAVLVSDSDSYVEGFHNYNNFSVA